MLWSARPKDVELKPGVNVHAHPVIHTHSVIHPHFCPDRRDGWPSLALKTANGKSNSLLVYGECGNHWMVRQHYYNYVI